jgi:hypothetical protein
MKFLKAQNLSKYGLTDNALRVNSYGRYIMDGTGALRLPKGTSAQRPQLANVSTPEGANGYIRYNTSLDDISGLPIGLEAYINGVWEVVRGPGAGAIYKQSIGPGNYEEIFFGPLDRVISSIDNILVFVENVFQISETNFTLVSNPSGNALATYGDLVEGQPYPPGQYLRFESEVPLDKLVTVYFGFAN